ncbi:exportin-T [Stegastes partitus]|uniref:Exportin-T n=2 Tax=Stegastes partitus TaxID=144197 RepID=A0A9Y4NAJ8_9TELE|nr:PREDICTED: exportin-T [Stegastes partitus]
MACQPAAAVMDEQALLGLNPNADARYRQRAMAYFEQLKESQDAWEVCAEALAKGIYSDDHVKFFCFQVLEHQIRFRHAGLSAVQQQLIRETLMKWLQCQLMNAQPEKPFIRNKAAQVFALTFIMEYLTLWPKFFFDILTLVGLNPHGVDVYLRTLMAIDAEVVDRDILHTAEVVVVVVVVVISSYTQQRSPSRVYFSTCPVTHRAENIERVVFTIIQGAVDFPDPIAQKTCFIILSKLVELWGGKDGMVGFPDFIYKHIVPACFLAPLKPTFDLSDAQTVLTLSECALTLKMIHLKRGPEFIQFLQQDYLPSLQVSPEISQELCQVLQQPDVKVLKNYIKAFFQRAKLFVNLLLSQMSVEELREEACDCLFEIINKGMDPVDKTKLVESLCQVLQSAGFFNVEQEEDVDFLAKFSRLVNGMGQSLVLSWTKLAKAGSVKEAAETLQALEAKVPLLLQLLVHEDDDISANIVGFCYEYLHVLKQLPQLTDQQKANIEAIMLAVMKKLTYDDEYNFENEGEDEAMFVEYRKQLKMLLDRLAQVSPELLLEAVRRVFTNTMQAWQSAAFMEVEVAIRLLYMLGEALPASHGAHFSGDSAKTSALQDMMRTLVSCGVSSYQHTSVSLEFFETVVRYDKFFIVEPQHIPNVLMAFLDQRGLRHNSPKVRSRVAYLFSRFIKTLQ